MTSLDVFFLLLRSSLYCKEISADDLPEHINWRKVADLAYKQTVVSLIADAASRLPADLQPPKEIMDKMRLRTISGLQTHARLNKAVADSVQALEEAGVRSVILKGQGIAKCYPVPELRQCGDVDLYVGPANYEKACQAAIQTLCDDPDKTMTNKKHLEFIHGGIPIEIHRRAFLLYTPWRKKKMYNWTDQQLDTEALLEKTVIGGREVYVPGLQFNILFIFYHLWHHFVIEGIGLRQLCDLAMLLHSRAADVDHDEINSLLKRFHLLHPWQLVGYILVDSLGLPESELPAYTPSVKKESHKVLAQIINGGNFGHHDKIFAKYKRSGQSAWGWRLSLVKYMANQISMKLRYDPIETACSHLSKFNHGVKSALFGGE